MALTDKLKAIANAIRGKTGNTSNITLDEMVTEINKLSIGGGVEGIIVDEYWSAEDVDIPRDDAIGFPKSVRVTGEHYIDNLPIGMFAYYTDSTQGSYWVYYYSPFTFLKSVNLPETITKIPDAMFIGQSKMTSYNLPDSVTAIGVHAFQSFGSSSNLFNNILPSSLITIGEYAFKNAYLSQNLILPEGLVTIGPYAFSAIDASGSNVANKFLYNVTFPQNSLKTIGDYAFYYRMNLKAINIPDSVTYLGIYAFYYCTSLRTIKFGRGISTIPAHCFYYMGLYGSGDMTIEFSDTITSFGDYAFTYSYFPEMAIPENLTSIGKYCFSHSYLTQFICKQVIYMNKSILEYCTHLTNVTLGGYNKPFTSANFYTTDTYLPFYKVTQTTLVITIYTEGGLALTGAPWGATGATIIYKDSTIEEEAS